MLQRSVTLMRRLSCSRPKLSVRGVTRANLILARFTGPPGSQAGIKTFVRQNLGVQVARTLREKQPARPHGLRHPLAASQIRPGVRFVAHAIVRVNRALNNTMGIRLGGQDITNNTAGAAFQARVQPGLEAAGEAAIPVLLHASAGRAALAAQISSAAAAAPIRSA